MQLHWNIKANTMQIPIDMPTIILMVEQNRHEVDSTLAAFREIWFDVYVQNVDTVDQAIEYLFRKGRGTEEHPYPDLVILGALTPVTDATHLLSITRKSRKLQYLPVVAMTCLDKANHQNLAEKLGVALVMPKSQMATQARLISEIMIDYWFESSIPAKNSKGHYG